MSIEAAVNHLRNQCKETTLFSVARGSGVSYPVVYRFAKDPSYKIRIDTLTKIENYFTAKVKESSVSVEVSGNSHVETTSIGGI